MDKSTENNDWHPADIIEALREKGASRAIKNADEFMAEF